ncbi:MAG: hypothetical protein EVA76_03910 [Candidatus Pelagibacterales bacterium]|nr:MAG: hypothetical protein EVA76_03910 [Pelagibacterales bacterium]
MLQAKSLFAEDIKKHPYLFLNIVFGFFPISFIIGTLIVNINLLLFCCLGIYYLKSKIITTKFDFLIKIIFLFFLAVFFSTSLSLAKTIYFEGYEAANIDRFVKSILFFRFFLFLIIIYLLNKFNFLSFKYFFLTGAFASAFISIDIIYQYFFGVNIFGLANQIEDAYYGKLTLERFATRNASFFGDEFIAGGYIQRFAFFSIFFTILVFKNNKYVQFVSAVALICILGTGIIFSGNRMPFASFLFGLLLIFLLNIKIKKILFLSIITLILLLKFIISSNAGYKNLYSSFYGKVKNVITAPFKNSEDIFLYRVIENSKINEKNPVKQKTTFTAVKFQSPQKRLFLTAIDTWKLNKIFGNGIKSFRVDCGKIDQDDVNITEDLIPGKKQRLCSNHPHNYYLEILTEMGVVGLIIIFVIAMLFIIFVFRNFKLFKQISFNNFLLLSATISLILEVQPFKTSGSLFTTNNATYIILIGSIILSYKTILKIKVK